jgi:hypothetical protein
MTSISSAGGRAGRVFRSAWVRVGFVVVAVAAAAVAVWASWPDVQAAVARLDPALVIVAVGASLLYMLATMIVWRVLLADLGSPLSMRDSFAVFFLSQLGKYVPGSVWNIVASAEMGADRKIPRRRSLTAMGVALLLSTLSGLALGATGLLLAPEGALVQYRPVLWLLPLLAVVALPPVANRLAALALRLLRRPGLEHSLTARGTLGSLTWAMAAWLLAGTAVWTIGVAVGIEPTLRSYLICTGAYALAWTLGFLFVPVPAGVGIREVVLAALMADLLDQGGILVVVLLSRAILTLVDVGLALAAVPLARDHRGDRARTATD